jgi:hypothetical protein
MGWVKKMIILIDVGLQLIKFYKDDGVEIYEFSEVDDLVEEIGDKTVLYVTNAMEASSTDISDLISQLNGYNINADDSGLGLNSLNEDIKFLHSTSGGTLHIQDVDITFHGPGDCKPLDEEMIELLKGSVVFRLLVQQGKIKVIDYNTMRRMSRKQQRKQSKNRKQIDAAKDKELDEILVNTSVPGSAEKAAEKMFDGPSDIVETDITDSIINDPLNNMTPEQIDKAVKSGNLAP